MNAAKSKLATRLEKIIQKLRIAYPDVRCELDHANPLQLLVATILSAQCTDVRVNKVTPALFAKYRTAADFAAAPSGELEDLIKSTGFFHNKAKSIRACCRAIADNHNGQVPATMAELVQLAGCGRKTASVVLGVAFWKAEGIVVDTHVQRLAQRLDLTRHTTPEKIERALMEIAPTEEWIDLSHLLIWHGRRRCAARKPDCANCELLPLCPQHGVQS
ncbi:MAG: endonuclease III [Verrucomicrobiota bacterium]